jgi:predicted RNase H-like HicB family nuclease
MKFMVILEPAEEGGFNVSVPALDGCYTQGMDEKEAIKKCKRSN